MSAEQFTHQSKQFASSIRLSLEEAFGTTFRQVTTKQLPTAPVWRLDEGRNGEEGPEPGDLHVPAILPPPQIRAFSVSPQETLIVVTPDTNEPDQHLAGEVCSADRGALLKTARFAWQASQQVTTNRALNDQIKECELHIESYAEQVSDSFEELVFLRELAGHIEQCEVPRDTSVVADAMLPNLRELLSAETLALVQSRVAATSNGELQTTLAGGQDNTVLRDKVVCRYDAESVTQSIPSRQINDNTILEVIKQFGSANSQPVVVNKFDADVSVFELLGVRNLVVLPVRRGEFRFGWLVALNKIPPAYMASAIADSDERLGYDEFGTPEAGLMQATTLLLATHARNLALFHEKESMVLATVMSLVRTLEARDLYTRGHSDRVADVARIIATEMGLPEEEVERIHLTGLLHDIGKIGIPDVILHKPDRLTDKEFAIIKQHPVIGYRILQSLNSISYVLPGVLHHHESVDGRGYPSGLKGDEIPLMARILAVADGYDAMTSDRPYRSGMPTEKAEAIIRKNRGVQWDANCVDAFFRRIEDIRGLSENYTNSMDISSITDDNGPRPVVVHA